MSSYLHSSWELCYDLDKFDLTGITSKIKVGRYVKAEEYLFGLKWRRIVEKQRTEIHRHIHLHGLHAWDETTEDGHAQKIFQSDYLEVYRILACDES